MATENQKKVIMKSLEKLGKNELLKKGEILRECGYSEKTATKNPKKIFESKPVQEGLKPFIDQLKEKRQIAINKMTAEKIGKEKAKDLAEIIDKLTKNIQLLSGGKTESSEIKITWR